MVRENNKSRPELIFWLDQLPRSAAGALRFTSQKWGNNVYYLCVRPLPRERKALGWEDLEHGKAIVTVLSELTDPEHFIKNFLFEHRDAIHVCNGFQSLVSKYTKRFLFPVPDANIAALSERPGIFESRKEQFLKWVGISALNRYYASRYSRKIRAYLPIGTQGLETFAKFKWPREVLFPFMYDSHIPSNLPNFLLKKTEEPLRFLYVGQFKWRKGVDLIMHAFNNALNGKWHLDLVGRNGAYEKQVVEWAKRHPCVSYLGVWPSGEVISRIAAEYDLCLVPSRFDGWGLVTNEAIHAGVGAIVSDATASCDLVKASGAGLVVPAGDSISLHKAIQMAIDNPLLVDSWKERARIYAPRITSESVGQYLVDVLDYSFLEHSKPRPICPWL